jgi:hypothetical protein
MEIDVRTSIHSDCNITHEYQFGFVLSFPITIGFILETLAMHTVRYKFEYSLTLFQMTIRFVLELHTRRPRRPSQL